MHRGSSLFSGFGLPLARAFARYFGGDISVQVSSASGQ